MINLSLYHLIINNFSIPFENSPTLRLPITRSDILYPLQDQISMSVSHCYCIFIDITLYPKIRLRCSPLNVVLRIKFPSGVTRLTWSSKNYKDKVMWNCKICLLWNDNAITKDRDEVNKRESCECDWWVCDLDDTVGGSRTRFFTIIFVIFHKIEWSTSRYFENEQSL